MVNLIMNGNYSQQLANKNILLSWLTNFEPSTAAYLEHNFTGGWHTVACGPVAK
jgi:hypothetical protein